MKIHRIYELARTGQLRPVLVERYLRTILFLETLAKLLRTSGPTTSKVLLAGGPFHPNLGDQAQTLCAIEWLQSNYPGREIIAIDASSASPFGYLTLRLAKKRLADGDPVFLHSGYHMTELYHLENSLHNTAMAMFPANKIVILPQTINYNDPHELAKAAALYNGHGNVTLLCRDDRSFETAKDVFDGCRLLLFPDIVTSKIGSTRPSAKRNGIQLCLRRDAESIYVASGLDDQLLADLQTIAPTSVTDTNSSKNAHYIKRNLSKVLNSVWDDFGKYKVTVTDRYHGVIFSLIAGTPVVVLRSADHKLESGVKWFPENIFGNYVSYADSVSEAVVAAEMFYESSQRDPLPPHFADGYYSQLGPLLAHVEGD